MKVEILDERMNNLIMSNAKEHSEIKQGIKDISVKLDQSIQDLCIKLEKGYVSKTEFDPIKRIVYGLVGVALLALAGAIINSVIVR